MARAGVAEIDLAGVPQRYGNYVSVFVEPDFDVVLAQRRDGGILPVGYSAPVVAFSPLHAVADRERSRLAGVDAEPFPSCRVEADKTAIIGAQR